MDTPHSAARLLGKHAAAGTRLFNPYNAGAQLLWYSAPPIRLYIDPRNNHGAGALQHYLDDLLPNTQKFEQLAAAQHVDVALADLSDGRMSTLAAHLDGSQRWRLIDFDGVFVLYATAQHAGDRCVKITVFT